MRQIVVISVVVLALLVCGGVVALAASGGKSTPISRAQAVAFATAVNLQAGDLPGYEIRRTAHLNGSEEGIGCNGTAHFRPVAAEVSPTFFSRANFVASVVAVTHSAALAKAALAATTSDRGRRCIARESKQDLGASTANVTFVPLAKMLGAGAIAVRAVAETKKLQQDEVIFRVGPALIVLFTFGELLLPAATEGRLLALLYSRAEAHKL